MHIKPVIWDFVVNGLGFVGKYISLKPDPVPENKTTL